MKFAGAMGRSWANTDEVSVSPRVHASSRARSGSQNRVEAGARRSVWCSILLGQAIVEIVSPVSGRRALSGRILLAPRGGFPCGSSARLAAGSKASRSCQVRRRHRCRIPVAVHSEAKCRPRVWKGSRSRIAIVGYSETSGWSRQRPGRRPSGRR